MNDWNVWFGNDFCGSDQYEHPCTELAVNRKFQWDNDCFEILSLYVCSEGLVMDFCKQIDPDKMRIYLENWKTKTPEKLSDLELELLLAENPAREAPETKLVVNGSPLQSLGNCCIWWQPGADEDTVDPLAEGFLIHYGLNPLYAWLIIRSRFLWTSKESPVPKHIELYFSDPPVSVAGPTFTLNEKGQQTIIFTHPQTGTQHTLQVKFRTFGQITKGHMPSSADLKHQPDNSVSSFQEPCIFPDNYEAIHYTLSPELADGTYSIRSVSSKGGKPISAISHSEPDGAHTISVIGSASDSTSVFLAGRVSEDQFSLHTAYSPIYFKPTEIKEWCIIFQVKRKKDCKLTLEL